MFAGTRTCPDQGLLSGSFVACDIAGGRAEASGGGGGWAGGGGLARRFGGRRSSPGAGLAVEAGEGRAARGGFGLVGHVVGVRSGVVAVEVEVAEAEALAAGRLVAHGLEA